MNKIPIISVKGSYYDIGYEIGSALQSKIKRTIRIPIKVAKEHQYFKIDYFDKMAKKYFPYANKYFPQYVTELKGLADGSDQDFDLIWLLNIEEVLMDKYFDKCTSVVLREEDDNVYLYHNEDFDDDFLNNLAIIKAKVKNSCNFLSFTFAGMLPGSSISMNSHGLVQGINSLEPMDFRVGVPKNFISRAILEAKNFDEALKILKINERASAYNHILIKGGKVMNVETTAKNYKVFNVKENVFAHTNNYLNKSFIDSAPQTWSKSRYNYVMRIIKENKIVDKNVIMSILTAHGTDTEEAICRHGDIKHGDRELTLASIIVDSNNLKMYVAKGNPCKNKHTVYSLD